MRTAKSVAGARSLIRYDGSPLESGSEREGCYGPVTWPRARAIINDDTPFLALMRELLEVDETYEVLICKEWDNAYQFVRDQQPDLIIQDIRIGGEEKGWTILNLRRWDPKRRR